MRRLALGFWLTLALLHAQTKVSRPGFYSGYSSVLYKDIAVNSEYLTMRDGTRLAATIYRPAIDGKAESNPWPVIWEGTTTRGSRAPNGTIRYNAMAGNAAVPGGLSSMSDLVKYGYVVVQVERRGLGASMGAMRGYHEWAETLDSYDITEWLAAQPWSSGKIGVFGCSNTGEAALHAPLAMPPHLKAVFAGCYSWNKFDGFFRGGILANWGTGPQSQPAAAAMAAIPVDADQDQSLLKQAVAEHQNQTLLLALWKSIPFRDSWSELVRSRFWMEGSVSTFQFALERSGVAIYSFGGWDDDFRREQFLAFSILHNPSKLLIGPWAHCRNDGFDLVTERLRFFDYWLKGVDNGIMQEPPISYYTVGAPKGDEWRTSAQWPLPSEPAAYYFATGNALTTAKPADRGQDRFRVNYDVGSDTRAAIQMTPPLWPLDSKGIVYTMAAVTSAMEITGHPIVHLWASSTAADGNFFAYLEDLAPDGQVTVLTEGRLKASLRTVNSAPYSFLGLPYHRSFAEDVQPLVAGQPAELVFDMLPLSRVIAVGHKIRATITGADPREKDREASSPAPEVTLWRDASHASHVVLPVISRN